MAGWGNLDWGNWLYGLFSGLIGGGAGAVVSGVTVSVIDPKDWAIGSSHFLVLTGTLFLTHGVLSAFMFLKQQPLPKSLAPTSVPETPTPPKP